MGTGWVLLILKLPHGVIESIALKITYRILTDSRGNRCDATRPGGTGCCWIVATIFSVIGLVNIAIWLVKCRRRCKRRDERERMLIAYNNTNTSQNTADMLMRRFILIWFLIYIRWISVVNGFYLKIAIITNHPTWYIHCMVITNRKNTI